MPAADLPTHRGGGSIPAVYERIFGPLGRGGRQAIPIVGLTFNLARETLVERSEIDHRSLMGSAADLLDLVARRYLELDTLSVDLGNLRFGANGVTDRRRGKVPDIDRGADRALARLEI